MEMGLIIIISALVAYTNYAEGQSACTTPIGRRGQCISIHECDPLLALTNNANRTSQDVDTLKKSKCGFQRGIPQVCCPSECFTIEGQLGTCISIQTCPHLNALLYTPTVSAETISYLQRSRCDGPDRYSVCCGHSANLGMVEKIKRCINNAAPPDPRTKCCGVESSGDDRIYGGNLTSIDQYPWLALIEYKKGSKIKLLCGGALISGKYVLTAGHCVVGPVLVSGTPTNVRLGEYDTGNDGADCANTNGGGLDCNEGTTVIPIERIIPYPEYQPSSSSRRHDIALLRLKHMAPYTDFIRPLCLPTSDLTRSPQIDLHMIAAGWGAVNDSTSNTNVRLQVSLPFRSIESCQPAYSIPIRNVSLWKGQLCAGGIKGQDSCKGDSGGPLMYARNGTIWEATGVVSFGTIPCGLENVPGVYTNVYHYIPWIRSQIRP